MKRKKLKLIILVFGMLGLCLFLLTRSRAHADMLYMDFFDVGQGDSIFITFPDRKQLLIDGGPDGSVIGRLKAVMPIGDTSIDWIILTHPDSDHLTGLIDVLDSYQVSKVIVSPAVKESRLYYSWIDKLENKNITPIVMDVYSMVKIGNEIALEFLSPTHETYDPEMNINNGSVVFKLAYLDFTALFTGDMETEVEERMLKVYDDLSSDLLKVGHHGSNSSSSMDFLQKVDPRLAVISVGKGNKFGHPHDSTLYRLKKNGIDVLRTDQEGNIRIGSDGRQLFRFDSKGKIIDFIFGKKSVLLYNRSTLNK